MYLMRTDVRQGASMLRRNMRTIRGWLEEEGGAQAIKELEKGGGGKKAKPPDLPGAARGLRKEE